MSTALMHRALLEAVLVGALCGAVGVHVVLRKQPFFALTVAHATFPGVVLAEIAGLSFLVGGAATASLVTIAVFVGSRDPRFDSNTVVGIVLSGTFAAGVLLLSARAGGAKDLSAFLVGSILTVDHRDIVATLFAGGVIVLLLAAFHKEFVFGALDPVGARASGIPSAIDLLMMLLIASAVVVALPVVGTMLSVALLTVPALAARLWADRVTSTVAVSAAIGAASGVIGLCVSAQFQIAAGGAIALSACAVFVVSLLIAPRSPFAQHVRHGLRQLGATGRSRLDVRGDA